MTSSRAALKVGLVELYADSVAHRVQIKFPSRSIDLLAAILGQNGFSRVETYNPIYDGTRGRVTRSDVERLASYDAVGFSAISSTQNLSYDLAAKLRKLNPRIKIVFGGYHTTCLPEETLDHADIAVLNEGDRTIVDVMDRIAEHKERPVLADVPGIVFRDEDGAIRHTAHRPLLTVEELEALPVPALPARVRGKMNCGKVVLARGCPFQCSFCTISDHFGRRVRAVSVERSVEIIERSITQFPGLHLFADDNFALNPERAKRILERILEKGLKMPSWSAQVRVDAAFDDDLLKLLRRAGCRKVFVGLESMNDESLKLLNKRSTLEKNDRAIRRFHEAGLMIHGHFMFGTDADSVDTVRTTAEYVRKMGLDTAYFLFMSPGPGSPLAQRYQAENKLITRNWARYDGNSVCVYPDQVRPSELKKAVDQAYLHFYSPLEALRYLFRPRKKLTTLLLRTVGYPVMRYLIRRDRPYVADLERLERWVMDFEAAFGKVKEDPGVPPAAREEFFRAWSDRARALAPDFQEFCRRKIDLAAAGPKDQP
ncbi:MAG: radical SAM protein [Candidatus Sericytochromatia bacterium]|nr:radical SAM protein [Candidatus Tanganyikabacteria bacterium]